MTAFEKTEKMLDVGLSQLHKTIRVDATIYCITEFLAGEAGFEPTNVRVKV